MQLRQLIERQLRFPIRQWKSDNNVLTAKLAPKRIRGPLLRLRSAQPIDPNQIPLSHNKRPRTRTLPTASSNQQVWRPSQVSSHICCSASRDPAKTDGSSMHPLPLSTR